MKSKKGRLDIILICRISAMLGILLFAYLLYMGGTALSVAYAKAGNVVSNHDIRLVDEAGLLSESEYNSVLSRLNEVSEKHQFEMVIVTEESIGGEAAMNYADDYYDNHNYGYGEERDGVLLLINMEDREWYISTSGFGINVINDSRIQIIGEHVASYLGDENNEEAFQAFVDDCDEYVTISKGGRLPFPWAKNIMIALVTGFVIGIIVVVVLKGQLKSVSGKTAATDYIVNNSMKIDDSRDVFLYANISKRPKPKQNSGSSTHSSSSGRSHGGGGGHF